MTGVSATRSWRPTAHPVMRLPSAADAVALGQQRLQEALLLREQRIADERRDPFAFGYEPGIWRVVDSLYGFPWCDPTRAAAIRARLGFPKPARVILLLGGNRSGKTTYAAKRIMRLMRGAHDVRTWCFHETLRRSIDDQQPHLYHYLPTHLKRKIQTDTTYIAYKRQTGFSGEHFILDNGSDCGFMTYEQAEKIVEGGNLNAIWCDELVPANLVSTLEIRIAEKEGLMLITFTPLEGYSPTVRLFLDGAKTVLDAAAYCLPKDGQAPAVATALGLTEEDYQELQAAATQKRPALAPQSQPERWDEWLVQGSDQPLLLPDRSFERVPRVARCASRGDGIERAVVWFHTADNPYGNPKSIWGTVANRPTWFIAERIYGVARKLQAAQFPLFRREVHTVDPAEIPVDGTNRQVIDPHGFGRNFFILWIRACADGSHYVYREFPGSYWIPGVGVPGPWAIPDAKHPDGAPGPGLEGFGWGYLRYKEEWARLEGWDDYAQPPAEGQSQQDWITAMDDYRGSAEQVLERIADSRMASTPKMTNDRPVTLITDFRDVGIHLMPAPGDDIEEGVKMINDALYYDLTQPISWLNRPRLRISRECENLIFALETWTGKEAKAPTLCPLACLRYYLLADCEYAPLRQRQTRPEAEERETVWA